MKARWPSGVAMAASVALAGWSGWSWVRAPRFERWSAVMQEHDNLTEARVAVTEIAWGIASCGERSGELPDSSGVVPPELSSVRGKRYQSRATDWNDTAFACAGFHMLRPQHFVYQWRRDDGGAEQGAVDAKADLDGDGAVDHELRLRVRCERDERGLRCKVDRMPTVPLAPTLGPAWWD
jgi:hypothetical protein